MRILVTGGAGFLGSHLCDLLIQEKHEVLCLDNLLTGSLNNIAHLQNHDNFQFIYHDIIDDIKVKVDGIFNLASPASPVHYQLNPINTLKTDIVGSLRVLEIAMANGARVVQASTSEVYGDPLQSPQNENYWGNVNPNGVRACYDEGKRAAETLFTCTFHFLIILTFFAAYPPVPKSVVVS